MLKVGLTGSIAVGKSFVCDVFRSLGVPVRDADETARDVVRPGTPGLAKIIQEFGDDVIRSDGELDRAKMAAIVFADEKMRLVLNSIVHPLVFEEQNRWLTEREAENSEIAIVDAALMIESGGYRRFNKLIVVFCEPAIQLERLKQRDNLVEAEAARRIAAQMPQEDKKRYADFLIDTSAGFDDTRKQVEQVYSDLLKLTGT